MVIKCPECKFGQIKFIDRCQLEKSCNNSVKKDISNQCHLLAFLLSHAIHVTVCSKNIVTRLNRTSSKLLASKLQKGKLPHFESTLLLYNLETIKCTYFL